MLAKSNQMLVAFDTI